MLRDESHLLHAANEMDTYFRAQDIHDYDLDDLGQTLLHLYDEQQQEYLLTNKFSLISTLSFALLELGIIVECEEETCGVEKGECILAEAKGAV